VVLSVANGRGACAVGSQPGQTAVEWDVAIDGDVLRLREDSSDPLEATDFVGALSGATFNVAAAVGPAGLTQPCPLREDRIVGTFGSDWQSLEGRETLVWGSPIDEVRVERRWRLNKN